MALDTSGACAYGLEARRKCSSGFTGTFLGMIDHVNRRAGPYVGDGKLTAFTFAFKIFASDDVKVLTATSGTVFPVELTYGSDFTVTLNDDQDATPGGTVELAEPLPEGHRLSIVSGQEYTQEVQLTNFSRFPPEIINTGLDRIVIEIQQLLEEVERCIKVPATSDWNADELVAILLEAADLARQVVAIAEEIKALGPVADDIAALGPHADAIQRISDRLEDLLQIDGIIGAIEDIEKNVELSQDAAEAAQAAADRAEELLGDLEGVFEENEALAALTENYMLILTSTAATSAAAFTRRDIEHYHRWEREGIALLRSVGSLALTRAEETRTDIEHWHAWFEGGLDLLRRAGTIALYAADASENDCQHFVAWFRKAEEHETAMLKALAEKARETTITSRNEIYAYHADIRTRALLIRTYVEKPVVLFIVAGQSNAVGFARPPYESAAYCGQMWDWSTGVNALKPLKDPTNAWYPNFGSAWPAFARHFFELTGRKVVLLNVARGGSAVTSVFSNTWYGDNTNTLRANAKTQYTAMTAALGSKDTDFIVGGLLWIQGEAETGALNAGTVSVADYKAGTLDVFSFFRTLTDEADMPVFMSQIGFHANVRTSPELLFAYEQIQQAQTELARYTEGVYMAFEGAKYFLDAKDMTDSIHYSQNGYNVVGEAFARCAATFLTL